MIVNSSVGKCIGEDAYRAASLSLDCINYLQKADTYHTTRTLSSPVSSQSVMVLEPQGRYGPG